MSFVDTLRVAIRALMKNKMRATLTVLGVVIGIAAVTTMVSIGQSASALVRGQFEAMGTNVIVVLPGSRNRGGVRQTGIPSLTAQDSNAISDQCRSVLAASPIVGFAGPVVFGGLNWTPKEMLGVGAEYLTVRNWKLAKPAAFSRIDENEAGARVCVLGHTLVPKLFQTAPIRSDRRCRIKNIPFRVIGVLETERVRTWLATDQDDVVLMPETTVRRQLYGSKFDAVHAIMVSARSPEVMDRAMRQVQAAAVPTSRHPHW